MQTDHKGGDMDMLVTFGSLAVGGYLWYNWYQAVWADQLHRIRSNPAIVYLQLVPVFCATIIGYVLLLYSASDVRSDIYYIFEYLVLGIAWVAVAEWLFRYMGISAIFDVVERRNLAALIAVAGGLIGVACCYSGGNIGEGPGAEVVFFSAGLVTLIYFFLWWLFSVVTRVDITITCDRDIASGVRLGGFLAAAGLILGRAAAGNWVSYSATVIDIALYGSPVLILWAAAVIIERRLQPANDHSIPSPIKYSALSAVFYIVCAAAYILLTRFPS